MIFLAQNLPNNQKSLFFHADKIYECFKNLLTWKIISLHGFMTEKQLLERLGRKGKSQKRRENRRYLEKHIKKVSEKYRMS